MRSDFIANASHELRTPLASLKGFIETLRGPARGDSISRERFLGIMETQADRMTRILDDLLSLSRIEMRAHIPPAGETDLVPILQSVMQALEPIAKDARISIMLNPVDAPARVRGDADELVQVFQNLIQNAIKYGRDGGKVDITVKRMPAEGRKAERFAITVADDGPGIAREHLPRLTERFYRVDTATSRARGGTGLGLAIAKHILNRHHGELDISSEPGKGSTFTVVLDALKS
jgi:two-component system phosphate regulon sensor histidine kinase PhoR